MPVLSRRAMLQALIAQSAFIAPLRSQTIFHQAPKPLGAESNAGDWPSFLGPTHNAVSAETKLSRSLPPPLVWEFPTGSGYASPAVAEDHLLFIHRVNEHELVECLNPESGHQRWQFRYESSYEDRYGYNNGPRSSPVVDITNRRVYTIGAEGQLHCLCLDDGQVIWSLDLATDYGVRQDFFGISSTPLLKNGLLIANIGAPNGGCVVAFEAATGHEVWRAGDWGPSYSSPVPALIHGSERILVFAGGESSPPAGGLLSIDPSNGKLDFEFPFRSRTYESVNASCPVAIGNKVFISASYRTGGALIEILEDFSYRVLWTTSEFALHYNTPIYKEGFLYGFDGRNMGDASLACLELESGQIVWREAPTWTENFQMGGRQQEQLMTTARGSLLSVDGQFLCLGELGHLIWMDLTSNGYKEISRTWLFAARESWALPVLSRGLLYVVQNSRDLVRGAQPRLLCFDLRL